MYRRLLAAIVALLLLAGCGGTVSSPTASISEAPASDASGGARMDSGLNTEQAAVAEGTTAPGANSNTASQSNAAQFARMVIKTAQISLLVENTDDAETKVRSLVSSMGGYVLNSATTGEEESRNVQLTFKVPAERFDDALNGVASFATKVQNRSVTGEDVTDQFVDTESRLRTLHATEARLLDFLKAARNTEEALRVNEQLTALQGEIEQASGRIQLLKQSTSYSTITVTMQPTVVFAITPDAGWSPWTVARQSWHNLVSFGQGLADLAIAITIWVPVWGTLAVIGLLVWRRLGRRPAPAPAPPAN
jgi:TolA-binding protein